MDMGRRIMSKVTLGILFAAIGLAIVATYFELSVVSGGSGVVLVVGLIYAFVVTKREIALPSQPEDPQQAE